MIFVNRSDAGVQLAAKLEQFLSEHSALYSKHDVVVVGLPRGGVIVALEVARRLKCPVDIIVSKKLPFPGQPELAIGAVSSDGVVVLNPDLPHDKQWTAYVDEERRRLLAQTKKREHDFHCLSAVAPVSFKDKTVIIVDDGIATGMTAMAAAKSAELRGARAIIMAVPVISSDSYFKLQNYCDDVVAICLPESFSAVGEFYVNFGQTTDEEVVQALEQSASFSADALSMPDNVNLGNHEISTGLG